METAALPAQLFKTHQLHCGLRKTCAWLCTYISFVLHIAYLQSWLDLFSFFFSFFHCFLMVQSQNQGGGYKELMFPLIILSHTKCIFILISERLINKPLIWADRLGNHLGPSVYSYWWCKTTYSISQHFIYMQNLHQSYPLNSILSAVYFFLSFFSFIFHTSLHLMENMSI